jgi:hypothetical protein
MQENNLTHFFNRVAHVSTTWYLYRLHPLRSLSHMLKNFVQLEMFTKNTYVFPCEHFHNQLNT